MTEDFELTDTHTVEIYPVCRASLAGKCAHNQPLIAFDAPRTVAIASRDKVRSGTQQKTAPRPTTNSLTKLVVAPSAIADGNSIGLQGDIQAEILGFVRLSAPITHERGIRRFEDLIFNIAGDVVEAIYRLSDDEREALDNGSYRDRRKLSRNDVSESE